VSLLSPSPPTLPCHYRHHYHYHCLFDRYAELVQAALTDQPRPLPAPRGARPGRSHSHNSHNSGKGKSGQRAAPAPDLYLEVTDKVTNALLRNIILYVCE
jgi:hypothetical protein